MLSDLQLQHVEAKVSGGVLTLTLNRPEALNAMNRRLVSDLRNIFQALYWERSVRVVVLRAAGRAFCAGLDLKEAADNQEGRPDVSAMLDRQRAIAEI